MRTARSGNQRISPGNMMSFVYCGAVAFGILLGPKAVIMLARESSPFIGVLGLGLSMLLLALYVWMADQFPKLTIFQWQIRLLGPFGYPLSALLVIYLMTLLVTHGYLFSVLLQMTILPRTPLPVIELTGLALATFGASLNVEAIARFFQLIMYVEFAILPPLFWAAPRDITWTHYLPWVPADLRTVLLGPLFVFAGFLGFAHAPFGLRPYVQAGGKIMRPALIGMVAAGVVISAFTAGVLGIFGPDVVQFMPFPTFLYSCVLHFPKTLVFLSGYSLFFISIWVIALTKLAILDLHLVALGTRQIFGIAEGPWVLLGAAAVVGTATALVPNLAFAQTLLTIISIVGVLIGIVLLPTLAALILLLRKRVEQIARDS